MQEDLTGEGEARDKDHRGALAGIQIMEFDARRDFNILAGNAHRRSFGCGDGAMGIGFFRRGDPEVFRHRVMRGSRCLLLCKGAHRFSGGPHLSIDGFVVDLGLVSGSFCQLVQILQLRRHFSLGKGPFRGLLQQACVPLCGVGLLGGKLEIFL